MVYYDLSKFLLIFARIIHIQKQKHLVEIVTTNKKYKL